MRDDKRLIEDYLPSGFAGSAASRGRSRFPVFATALGRLRWVGAGFTGLGPASGFRAVPCGNIGPLPDHGPAPPSHRPGRDFPDHLENDHIGVTPAILAEELDWCAGVADEGAKDPAHLNADEDVDDDPGPEHPAVGRVAHDQGTVLAAEQPL